MSYKSIIDDAKGKCGIYRIFNSKNKKMYIGSSKNIGNRWRQHINNLNKNKHHSSKLQRAWNKVKDRSVFKFEILELVKEEDLLKIEQTYIDKYDSFNNGYNCNKFTEGVYTETTKKNMNASKLKKDIKEYWKNILLPKINYIEEHNNGYRYVSEYQRYKFESYLYKKLRLYEESAILSDWIVKTNYFKSKNCKIRLSIFYSRATLTVYFINKTPAFNYVFTTYNNKVVFKYADGIAYHLNH